MSTTSAFVFTSIFGNVLCLYVAEEVSSQYLGSIYVTQNWLGKGILCQFLTAVDIHVFIARILGTINSKYSKHSLHSTLLSNRLIYEYMHSLMFFHSIGTASFCCVNSDAVKTRSSRSDSRLKEPRCSLYRASQTLQLDT